MKSSFLAPFSLSFLVAAGCGGPPSPAKAVDAAEAGALVEHALAKEAIDNEYVAAHAEWLEILRQGASASSAVHMSLAAIAVDAMLRSHDVRSARIGGTALYLPTDPSPGIRNALRDAHAPSAALGWDLVRRLAEDAGNAKEAEEARVMSGCVRSATFAFGRAPETRSYFSDVEKPDTTFAPLATFRTDAAHDLTARGCNLFPEADAARRGLHVFRISLTPEAPKRVHLALRTNVPVVGMTSKGAYFTRSLYARAHTTLDWYVIDAEASESLTLYTPENEGQGVLEIFAVDDDGKAIRSAPERIRPAPPNALQTPTTFTAVRSFAEIEGSPTLRAASLLSRGYARGVEDIAVRTPGDLVLQTRARFLATDLPETKLFERLLAAYDTDAFQAKSAELAYGKAYATAERLSPSERALRLSIALEQAKPALSGLGGALFDLELAAIARAEDLERRVVALASPAPLQKTRAYDRVRIALDTNAKKDRLVCRTGTERNTLGCYDAVRSTGDLDKALSELNRVRAVVGNRSAFQAVELRLQLERNAIADARTVYGRLPTRDRRLSWLSDLYPETNDQLRSEFFSLASTAADGPDTLLSVARTRGWLPALPTASTTRALIDKAPANLGAATDVIKHTETYAFETPDLLRFRLWDVRRVGGTTDVEESAQAGWPMFDGRAATRASLKRIFKRDGRVVERDRTPNAAQAHADLSQLEPGDVVEVVYEGFIVRNAIDEIAWETYDLLPERTSIRNASIELSYPSGVVPTWWSHPILGAGKKQSRDGVTRVVWALDAHPGRFVESNAAVLDRSVGVRVSSMNWSDVARNLREASQHFSMFDPDLRALDGADVDGKKTVSLAGLADLAKRVASAVKEPSGFGHEVAWGPVTDSVRSVLSGKVGSRSYLFFLLAKRMGFPVELALAEEEAYGDETPPSFTRFSHVLVRAKVEDTWHWVDLDHPGKPMPIGSVAPELSGRKALVESGNIVKLPDTKGDAFDRVLIEADVTTANDVQGKITAKLRTDVVQKLSRAFETTVGFERERLLREVIKGYAPSADILNISFDEDPSSITVVAKVRWYALFEADRDALRLPGVDALHWVFPNGRSSKLRSVYGPLEKRESSLEIYDAANTIVDRKISFPSGWHVDPCAARRITHVIVETERTCEWAGQTYSDHFKIQLRPGQLRPEVYQTFVAKAAEIDASFLESVKVQKSGAPASK